MYGVFGVMGKNHSDNGTNAVVSFVDYWWRGRFANPPLARQRRTQSATARLLHGFCTVRSITFPPGGLAAAPVCSAALLLCCSAALTALAAMPLGTALPLPPASGVGASACTPQRCGLLPVNVKKRQARDWGGKQKKKRKKTVVPREMQRTLVISQVHRLHPRVHRDPWWDKSSKFDSELVASLSNLSASLPCFITPSCRGGLEKAKQKRPSAPNLQYS